MTEVLVAMVVLCLGVLTWVRLEGRLAAVERRTEVRRALAAWMRDELRLQRSVRAFACGARPPREGWRCTVARRCVDGAACEAESVTVTIDPPEGATLRGSTAVWWPLQRASPASGP